MKRLAPNLFDRRFGELMEMGRARLPGLAPGWTDYNAHDPGITLTELLAWVTEAQLYSLGRMRRDERAAYAALFGLVPRGTEPARGVVWRDPLDPRAPAAVFTQSVVIAADAVASMLDVDTPVFRPIAKLLWVAGRVRRLTSRLAGGKVADLTAVNERGGPAFQPFGSIAGPNDVLSMDFECRGDGLFPENRSAAADAFWPIGIRADRALSAEAANPGALFEHAAEAADSPLSATLVTSGVRTPIRIAQDSSDGMLRTGVLLLDLSAVEGSPKAFTIEFRSSRGFERPPRLLRIEPTVWPIVQGQAVPDEVHVSTGIPDWSFQLELPGLRFAPFESPVKVELRDDYTNTRKEWKPAPLDGSGPDDAVYEFDAVAGRIRFGNGVNGRIPPRGATMLATYAVSDGDRGNVAPNRKWKVSGFGGTFGVNIDGVTGGAAPTDSIDERREARRRARDDHALISADDIESAALELPLLEVSRAWVLSPDEDAPRTGAVNLLAMRARTSEEAAGNAPESARWLEAIRRRLAPNIPMATRLVVRAPRYVDFSIESTIEIAAGRDPATVKAEIERALKSRLALTGPGGRHLGVPVTGRDVTAWIRVVDGVRRVTSLRLLSDDGRSVDPVEVPRTGLPRCDFAATVLDVRRTGSRSTP
jgi:predicted phage baseplate assembly protein